ncbi:hypothetical protein CDAR_605721 [Caerostris darwini]|uniref:Uncharacterized protein n=1 Tax=Caerostris darwini TaxID=1538125 RepID=A0AAV4U2T2_9ARAC|nr:hypothetical protein CDAR_432051 [Caerostris darwini]GIY54646.1 hypothetical protein CDAR_605721 [Caerostris darwini]
MRNLLILTVLPSFIVPLMEEGILKQNPILTIHTILEEEVKKNHRVGCLCHPIKVSIRCGRGCPITSLFLLEVEGVEHYRLRTQINPPETQEAA